MTIVRLASTGSCSATGFSPRQIDAGLEALRDAVLDAAGAWGADERRALTDASRQAREVADDYASALEVGTAVDGSSIDRALAALRSYRTLLAGAERMRVDRTRRRLSLARRGPSLQAA